MACRAPLFHRIVFVLVLAKLLTHSLMTIEAEHIAGLEKVILVTGGVRVVTFQAAAIGDHLVGADRPGRHHGLMALLADTGGVGLQKFAEGSCVWIMAAGALPLLQGGMDKGLLQLLL